jgi:hypothetical protein
MWKDPVVEETQKRRGEYAKKFNHDIDAIYADIQRRQKMSSEKLRKPSTRKQPKSSNTA